MTPELSPAELELTAARARLDEAVSDLSAGWTPARGTAFARAQRAHTRAAQRVAGALGGRTAAARLTPEQRSARARAGGVAAASFPARVRTLAAQIPEASPEQRAEARELLRGLWDLPPT